MKPTPLERAALAASGISQEVWPLALNAGSMLRTWAVNALGKHESGVIVLAGPLASGKTTASAVWCWALRGLYVRATELTRSDWYCRGCTDRLFLAPALVIAGLGAEYSDKHGYWASRFEELVTRRTEEAEERATVITTHFTPKEFARISGDVVMDRIRRNGRIVPWSRGEFCRGEMGRPEEPPGSVE